MCCIISDEPIQDPSGRIKTAETQIKFQTGMIDAPCSHCPTGCLWFLAQANPFTCICAQYFLRRKALKGDMTKYVCFQGYISCCCIQPGNMCERDCPDLCLCIESCLCNSFALSGTRNYVMDQYQLSSDPCDYRIIRFNNFMQCLDCFCSILACFCDEIRPLARLVDHIADVVYCVVSGCMTAQVAIEMDYQISRPDEAVKAYPVDGNNVYYADVPPHGYVPPAPGKMV